jgi:hypothetical protein
VRDADHLDIEDENGSQRGRPSPLVPSRLPPRRYQIPAACSFN